jgi:hypothetical protein
MHEGWLRNVRLVLTCRLNVWDASMNALDGFDVYRNLDFEYPTEVHQFMNKWFATEPELQQKLKVALEQPGKERIRDMVKNPLRLTLLCYSWQVRQGELPETKTGLYEWFVDTLYKWNKSKGLSQLNSQKRKELNQALGELSKAAIDQESSRFRLRETFINQFLCDADDEDSLFYLALQIGWLNRIGVAEENPLENVYAFFHPTFQEYFAALAIDDWDYFLPRNHKDKPSQNQMGEFAYRIFEAQWREPFLLWLGRKELENDLKNELLWKLYNFDDGCRSDKVYQGLYKQKYLYSLLESGSREFTSAEINKITWFDEEDGSFDTYVSEKYFELEPPSPDSLFSSTTKVEEQFIENSGYWMHVELSSHQDPVIEAFEYFIFERITLKENKPAVDALKAKYESELSSINEIDNVNELLHGLLNKKVCIIHGAFIKRILTLVSANSSLEEDVSKTLCCELYQSVYPEIVYILGEANCCKPKTVISMIDLLGRSEDITTKILIIYIPCFFL